MGHLSPRWCCTPSAQSLQDFTQGDFCMSARIGLPCNWNMQEKKKKRKKKEKTKRKRDLSLGEASRPIGIDFLLQNPFLNCQQLKQCSSCWLLWKFQSWVSPPNSDFPNQDVHLLQLKHVRKTEKEVEERKKRQKKKGKKAHPQEKVLIPFVLKTCS